jgi:hypothetical protein
MKKKILMIMLAFIMTVTFMPSMAFAATAGSTGTATQAKWNFRAASSDMVNMKQQVIEVVTQVYSLVMFDQSRYIPSVWQDINSIYYGEIDRINNATSIDEIVSYNELLGSYTVGPETLKVVEELAKIADYTKQDVRSDSDLARYKASLMATFKDDVTSYKRSDYNTYYWDVFLEKKAELYSEISHIKSFKALVVAQIDEATYLESDSSEDEDSSWLYTKGQINVLKVTAFVSVKDFIKTDLAAMGYKGKASRFDKIMATFSDKMESLQDYESIVDAQKTAITDIVKASGLKEGVDYTIATSAQKTKLIKKLEDVYFTYYSRDYSESGWSKISDIYDETTSAVEEMYISSQFTDQVVAKMKKKMDSVPTYKEELTARKAAAIKTLKKYKASPKYDSKKVSGVVASGITAVKKCTTLKQLNTVMTRYKAKVAKTIKKYKISTSKYGKGTVTKSRYIKYGAKYKVKVMPKAGYRIYSVRIDGKYVKVKYSYTFKNIKKKHTLRVIFSR